MKCGHCNNVVTEDVYASYTFEAVFIIFKIKNFSEKYQCGEISCVCPICQYGFQVSGLGSIKARNKVPRKFFASKAQREKNNRAAEMAIAEEKSKLEEFETLVNRKITYRYYQNLKPWRKNGYLKMLSQLGLNNLSADLTVLRISSNAA